MSIKEVFKLKAERQAASASPESASDQRSPGKLKKLFGKSTMAIAAGTMLAATVVTVAGDSGSGAVSCQAQCKEHKTKGSTQCNTGNPLCKVEHSYSIRLYPPGFVFKACNIKACCDTGWFDSCR